MELRSNLNNADFAAFIQFYKIILTEADNTNNHEYHTCLLD